MLPRPVSSAGKRARDDSSASASSAAAMAAQQQFRGVGGGGGWEWRRRVAVRGSQPDGRARGGAQEGPGGAPGGSRGARQGGHVTSSLKGLERGLGSAALPACGPRQHAWQWWLRLPAAGWRARPRALSAALRLPAESKPPGPGKHAPWRECRGGGRWSGWPPNTFGSGPTPRDEPRAAQLAAAEPRRRARPSAGLRGGPVGLAGAPRHSSGLGHGVGSSGPCHGGGPMRRPAAGSAGWPRTWPRAAAIRVGSLAHHSSTKN